LHHKIYEIEMNNPGEGTNETTSGCCASGCASISDSICESQNENEDDTQDRCSTRSHEDDYEYDSVPLLMQNSEIQTSSTSTSIDRYYY
jgi:hypothetical protein